MAEADYSKAVNLLFRNFDLIDPFKQGLLGESTRVYNSNYSALSAQLDQIRAVLTSRTSKYSELVGRGGKPSNEDAAEVLMYAAFYLKDIAIAVVSAQRDRLNRGKFVIPTTSKILNFPASIDTISSFGKYLKAHQGENRQIDQAYSAYQGFVQLMAEERENTARASGVREERKQERREQPPPPAASTPEEQVEAQVEVQSLARDPGVEEQITESEELIEIGGGTTTKIFLRNNWWVFVALGVGLYTFSVWRARQKRRQLQERL